MPFHVLVLPGRPPLGVDGSRRETRPKCQLFTPRHPSCSSLIAVAFLCSWDSVRHRSLRSSPALQLTGLRFFRRSHRVCRPRQRKMESQPGRNVQETVPHVGDLHIRFLAGAHPSPVVRRTFVRAAMFMRPADCRASPSAARRRSLSRLSIARWQSPRLRLYARAKKRRCPVSRRERDDLRVGRLH